MLTLLIILYHNILNDDHDISNDDDYDPDCFVQGKLNLVDLAGSERQSKTEATGDRLKEVNFLNCHCHLFLASSSHL